MTPRYTLRYKELAIPIALFYLHFFSIGSKLVHWRNDMRSGFHPQTTSAGIFNPFTIVNTISAWDNYNSFFLRFCALIVDIEDRNAGIQRRRVAMLVFHSSPIPEYQSPCQIEKITCTWNIFKKWRSARFSLEVSMLEENVFPCSSHLTGYRLKKIVGSKSEAKSCWTSQVSDLCNFCTKLLSPIEKNHTALKSGGSYWISEKGHLCSWRAYTWWL